MNVSRETLVFGVYVYEDSMTSFPKGTVIFFVGDARFYVCFEPDGSFGFLPSVSADLASFRPEIVGRLERVREIRNEVEMQKAIGILFARGGCSLRFVHADATGRFLV